MLDIIGYFVVGYLAGAFIRSKFLALAVGVFGGFVVFLISYQGTLSVGVLPADTVFDLYFSPHRFFTVFLFSGTGVAMAYKRRKDKERYKQLMREISE